MANQSKKDQSKPIDVEFKISMHCNACERDVAKVISKLKGVEKFMTDMNNHRVVVTGRIDPKKALKKLKKKTGKRVEIIQKKKDEPIKEEGKEHDSSEKENYEMSEKDLEKMEDPPFFGYGCRQSQVLLVFSDENPNGLCSIM